MSRELYNKMKMLTSVSLKWSLARVSNAMKPADKPLHVFFCLVDHYEPGTGGVSKEIELKRVEDLKMRYPKIANAHKDFYGNIPKRTWFFPPHYHRNYNLKNLVSLCEQGYGEIELHLHHGKHQPDTSENLKNTILQCVEEYSRFGIFGEQSGNKKYGFIHGDWALANSRYGRFCGVNDELKVLEETGCYADFTFPAPNEANPSQINSIYYASNKSNNPKSYNYGTEVVKGSAKTGDLMIIQGPVYPFLLWNKKTVVRCLGDEISGRPPADKKRIDRWIKTKICIQGKRDFIFVKTHTHGATDSDAVLGHEIDEIFSYLETKYNDGNNYILHYVTARELYNIIKAVESGDCTSDPEPYRDCIISKPAYNSSIDISESSNALKEMVARTYWG
ncbi:MAG: hypothetical protein GY795_22185 [Desulfobacterales bacterium]|nr:hypothetical protein [Desulfobacterales bacterium]